MTKHNSYTLSQIKESFNQAADGTSLITQYFLRPISFYVTYVLLKFKLSANQVTILSLFLGLCGMTCFITGERFLFSLGVIFYLLSLILDFADGNIARTTDTATYYGKFLDGAVNGVIEVNLPISIAIGFYLAGHGGDLSLFIGISTAIVLALAAFLLNRLSFFNRLVDMDVREGKIESPEILQRNENSNPLKSTLFPAGKIGHTLWDLKILILVLAAVVEMDGLLFLFLMAAIAIRALLYLLIAMIEAPRQLDFHKISKSDPRSEKKNP
mgnify:CR=1 FL=1